MEINKRKSQIKEEIKKLEQELNEIELLDKNIKKANKVSLGDYLLFDKEHWKIAEICEDEDGNFRVYYIQYKEVSHEIYETIEDLYIAWITDVKDVKYVPVKADRVKSLEYGKTYFIFGNNDWKILKIDIEKDIAIAYNIEDETDIIQADTLEILYINLLEEYEYIAEVYEEE